MWDAQIDDPFGSALRFAPLVVRSGEESLETGPIFCCGALQGGGWDD